MSLFKAIFNYIGTSADIMTELSQEKINKQ